MSRISVKEWTTGFPKSIELPHVRKLSELVDNVTDWKDRTEDGIYCTIRNHRTKKLPQSLNLMISESSPLQSVIDSMKKVVNDTFYVEIVPHNDRTALVIVQYNSIIGSRYAARIWLSSIKQAMKS